MSITVPDEQKLAEISGEVAAIVVAARQIEVSTPEQASDATAFLAEIKASKMRNERARKFLVDPLNIQIKKINALFKETTTPLDVADRFVRRKVLDYQREQERLRAEEQARLDAQRRAEEEAAAAERQRAEEAARAAEREAAEAERKRQAQRGKRRKEIAAMDDDELAMLIEGQHGDVDMRLAEEEAAARKQACEAQERAEVARREAEEALQRSIALQAAPALQVAAAAPLAAAVGSASVRREWRATIVCADQVPREYMDINMPAIRAAVRRGVREIPGVKIEQVGGLAVRAR